MKNKTSSKKAKTFAQDVIASFDDFFGAVERGETISVRTVKLDLKVSEFSAKDVQAVRTALGVSQAVFAQLLTVSGATVRAWEQGRRNPPAIARRLLDDIRTNTPHWQKVIARAAQGVA